MKGRALEPKRVEAEKLAGGGIDKMAKSSPPLLTNNEMEAGEIKNKIDHSINGRCVDGF